MINMIKFLPNYCDCGAVHHPGKKTDVVFFYIPLLFKLIMFVLWKLCSNSLELFNF